MAILDAIPLIALKWPNAARMMRHFLGNSGSAVNVDPGELMSDIPEFKQAVEATIHREVSAIVAMVIDSGEYGKPLTFRTGWIGFYPDAEKYPDWFRAIGGFDYSVGGVVTVYEPAKPGDPPTVRVDSQVDIADRYNWDVGKSTKSDR
ncbi:hypothetical protein [Nocardia otitidiscaviarum]|uniref:hypothetical protein n=1 Tax=Nocardia otitidiscaviarum TaxID=1823 RepID=UPI002457A770|nr:hypothetical protein [Nocardia otitidiscaviarum]